MKFQFSSYRLSSSGERFHTCFVGNPEDRFSRDEAQMGVQCIYSQDFHEMYAYVTTY